MPEKQWEIGDRVWLRPDGRTYATGTVTGVDTKSYPGVLVKLDDWVNGTRDAYATHDELRGLVE